MHVKPIRSQWPLWRRTQHADSRPADTWRTSVSRIPILDDIWSRWIFDPISVHKTELISVRFRPSAVAAFVRVPLSRVLIAHRTIHFALLFLLFDFIVRLSKEPNSTAVDLCCAFMSIAILFLSPNYVGSIKWIDINFVMFSLLVKSNIQFVMNKPSNRCIGGSAARSIRASDTKHLQNRLNTIPRYKEKIARITMSHCDGVRLYVVCEWCVQQIADPV